jgi:hypothetical protein
MAATVVPMSLEMSQTSSDVTRTLPTNLPPETERNAGRDDPRNPKVFREREEIGVLPSQPFEEIRYEHGDRIGRLGGWVIIVFAVAEILRRDRPLGGFAGHVLWHVARDTIRDNVAVVNAPNLV